MGDGCEAQPDLSPNHKAPSKRSAAAQPFRLRVALRSKPPAHLSTDDEEAEEEERKVVKKVGMVSQIKKERHVKFEDEEEAVTRPSPSAEPGSDSADESFLAKREQNIKANKAMVTQTHRPIHSIVQE